MDKEPINLFLDTTLTFQDPFFKKNYNHQLIRLSEIHGFPIYMSKVVFDETRNKFEQNVKDHKLGLENALRELENYYPSNLDTVTIKCTLDDFIRQFDEFYLDLIDRKILHIIDYENSMLPVLVERSIKKLKPFGIKKQEFRDAITWLSYTRFAESKSIDNCFFITNNLEDFCDNKAKNTIHPELLGDSVRFSHFVSARDLFEIEQKLEPYVVSAEIVEWIQALSIDSFIEDKFNGIFAKHVTEAFSEYVHRWDMYRFVDSSNVHFEGYIKVDRVSVALIQELNTTIVNDQVVVTGDISVDVDIVLYYEDEDSHYTAKVGADMVQLISSFTFTMDKKSINEDSLEFDNFEVIQVAEFGHLLSDDDQY